MTADNDKIKSVIALRDFVDNVCYGSIGSVGVSAAMWLIIGVKHWLEVGIWGGSYSVCGFLNVDCWPVTGWVGWDSITHYLLGMSGLVAWFWLSIFLVALTAWTSGLLEKAIRAKRSR